MLSCSKSGMFLSRQCSNRIASCPSRNLSSYSWGHQGTYWGSQNRVLWSWGCSFCKRGRIPVAIFPLCRNHTWLLGLETSTSNTQRRNRFSSFFIFGSFSNNAKQECFRAGLLVCTCLIKVTCLSSTTFIIVSKKTSLSIVSGNICFSKSNVY